MGGDEFTILVRGVRQPGRGGGDRRPDSRCAEQPVPRGGARGAGQREHRHRDELRRARLGRGAGAARRHGDVRGQGPRQGAVPSCTTDGCRTSRRAAWTCAANCGPPCATRPSNCTTSRWSPWSTTRSSEPRRWCGGEPRRPRCATRTSSSRPPRKPGSSSRSACGCCAKLAAPPSGGTRSRHGRPPLTISVNLSPRQFAEPDLVEQVRDIIAETGIRPELLRLEITESMTMDNADHATEVLNSLCAREFS